MYTAIDDTQEICSIILLVENEIQGVFKEICIFCKIQGFFQDLENHFQIQGLFQVLRRRGNPVHNGVSGGDSLRLI